MDAGKALTTSYVWSKPTVTWGDPKRGSDYGSYRSDLDRDGRDAPFDSFSALTDRQWVAARFALDIHGGGGAARAGFAVEGFTGLDVRYAGSTASADIRLANAQDAGTAYAYLPGSGVGGDVWFGGSGARPQAGNYDHMTVLHEVGHALGLEHGHAAGLPLKLDTLEYTVMTYRAWQGAAPNGVAFEAWGAPQTYMMLDIAALQQLYGADYQVNSDDTVYRWKPGSGSTWVNGEVGIDPGGDVIFATIWDGGGCDRYDLRAYSDDLCLDLRPGEHSVFDRSQLAYLGGGPNGGHARGSIFNALQHDGDRRSLIEDATGGAGDDRLTGNAATNRLVGGDGDDRLAGLTGRDVLVGGRGADIFVFARVEASPEGRCDRLAGSPEAGAFEGAGTPGGDRIDLRGIDADVIRSGDQTFVFGTVVGRGRLWLEESDGTTLVCGSVDRDDRPEFVLEIADGAVRCGAYAAGDFLL